MCCPQCVHGWGSTWTPRAVSRLTLTTSEDINLCVVSYSCNIVGFVLFYPSRLKSNEFFFLLLTSCSFTLGHHQHVALSKPAKEFSFLSINIQTGHLFLIFSLNCLLVYVYFNIVLFFSLLLFNFSFICLFLTFLCGQQIGQLLLFLNRFDLIRLVVSIAAGPSK